MHLSEQIYFVTNRTIEERFWLTPCHKVRSIFGRWLAKAAKKRGVEIFAYCVMSNHYHLLVRAPRGNLSAFMEYLQANVAKSVNRLHGRRGPLWQRRYSAEPVLDTDAMVDRIAYIVSNPVTAHAVATAEIWPGLSSISDLTGKNPQSFELFDATGWHKARGPADRRPFLSTVTLTISRLPALAHLDDPAYRQRILDAVAVYTQSAAIERRRRGIRVMGLAKLRRLRPSDRPKKPKRSPRPRCHTTVLKLWKEFQTIYRDFVTAYRIAAEAYRQGHVTTIFPRGSFPPSRHPSPPTMPA
jgi:REP element-mobilizing transposase RayT